jgi:predicted kinase
MTKGLNKLYVLVGVPGSGKSTWIANHQAAFKHPYKVVSRDKIRFSLLKENEDYFSKEKETYNQYIKEIKENLNDGYDVFADATHLNRGSRTKLLRALRESLKDITVEAIVINVSLKTALKQNNLRTGRELVPEDAIRRMYNQFSIPSFDEGFDKIWVYQNEDPRKNKYLVYRKD